MIFVTGKKSVFNPSNNIAMDAKEHEPGPVTIVSKKRASVYY